MKKKSKESVIRARVEETLKNEFEAWCAAHDMSVSQAIRALLRLHLNLNQRDAGISHAHEQDSLLPIRPKGGKS